MLTEETILDYLREGWRFRRKKVGKKYEYIVMRLKGVDKSLGALDEKVWSLVERLQRSYLGDFDSSALEDVANASAYRSNLTRKERIKITRAGDRFLWSLSMERGHIKSK